MIKLKGLIKESSLPNPKDDTDAEEYVFDFQQFVADKLPKLNGWVLDYNNMSGAFEWETPGQMN